MSHHGKWQSIHWSHMEWSALGSETQEVEILIRDIICEAIFLNKWPQGLSKDAKCIFFFLIFTLLSRSFVHSGAFW